MRLRVDICGFLFFTPRLYQTSQLVVNRKQENAVIHTRGLMAAFLLTPALSQRRFLLSPRSKKRKKRESRTDSSQSRSRSRANAGRRRTRHAHCLFKSGPRQAHTAHTATVSSGKKAEMTEDGRVKVKCDRDVSSATLVFCCCCVRLPSARTVATWRSCVDSGRWLALRVG